MNRVGNVVRMQLVNRQTFIWVPLLVLGGTLAVTLMIWAMLPPEAVKYGGGAQAPMWYFFAVGIMGMTQTFPFSQAMSVTRREFFLGSLLTAGLTSAILTVIFVIGGFIENATNGWGVNGYFFYLDWIWSSGPVVAAALILFMTMTFFVTGFAIATIYKRFGPTVLTVILVGLGLLLVGAMWLIGRLNAWGQVFGWIVTQGPEGLAVGLLITLVALSGIAYGLLRRTIP